MPSRATPGRRTIVASSPLRLLERGVTLGLPRQEMAQIVGLEPGKQPDPESRAPIERLFELWEYIERKVQDPSLPLRHAEGAGMEDYDVMGLAVLTGKTGRESLARWLRYARLFDDSGQFLFEVGKSGIKLGWRRDDPLTLGVRLSNECVVAGMLNAARRTAGHVTPISASFRHKAPADTRAHRRYFQCDVEFGAAEDAVIVHRDLLDGQHDVNPGLSALVERQAEAMLARVAEAGVGERARHSIGRNLAAGEPSSAAIAQELGMSERTFRRRLEEEGTSFRELVELVRRERAEQLLQEGRSSITEIAFVLGFSDPSAFSRAFRRWHQVGPREYREARAG